MRGPVPLIGLMIAFVGMIVLLAAQVDSQEPVGAGGQPAVGPEPGPDVAKGVEVVARGPVHEAVAAPGNPPEVDMFYVPGYWQWNVTHYVWRPGYWRRVQPGYVYVPAHYRWTPSGYVFIPGYVDYAVAHRGVIYAPVVINTAVVP